MTPKKIPFHIPSIEEAEIDEVVDTLKSGWLTAGPKVRLFEEALQKYLGVSHVVAVSSCSAALHLSLQILGIKEGDEVITTPLTFVSTLFSITQNGGVPVLADVENETLTLDPKKIESKITSKTKAIIPVHYGGHPCRMQEILEIAKAKNLVVVEDAAHAIGTEYQGKKIGALDSDATCFSFYANKNLSIGEGGAIATNNEEFAARAKILSLHGMSRDAWGRYDLGGEWAYDILGEGYKYNLTDLQAAIGIHQLRRLDTMNQRRRELVEIYNRELEGLKDIGLPSEDSEASSAWHLYPIRILQDTKDPTKRNLVIDKLKEKGIGTSVHFIPVFLFQYIQDRFGFHEDQFPVARKAFSEIISLPLYPAMKEEEVVFVTNTLKETLKSL